MYTIPDGPPMFQSAPGGEAGGNEIQLGDPAPRISFNPPPAVRPGETKCTSGTGACNNVSIRPRR